MFCFQNN
jgi:DNA topoisomerase IA